MEGRLWYTLNTEPGENIPLPWLKLLRKIWELLCLFRVLLEGVVFNVRSMLGRLEGVQQINKVFVSGSAAKSPFVRRLLSWALDKPAVFMEDENASLTGAAKIIFGDNYLINPRASITAHETEMFHDDHDSQNLKKAYQEKYMRWKSFLKPGLSGSAFKVHG